MKDVEILAPVGSIDALYAAIENGANAVYLGGKVFNARAYASNFENEDLKEAVKYAHIRNVKVYVTLNILLDNEEIEEVIKYLIFLYNIDVDAVIIQDLGLARIIKRLFPDFELHGSTQMTVHNYMAVKFLEDLEFDRVVLARELSVEEIDFINKNSSLELEGFVHGALCVSYSGQCLMSSIIGGRSGNRGRCAQPCRMPYSIVDDSDNTIDDKFDGKYLLSPKDLNTIEYLDKIVSSGITSLKIEGRMKSPGYVAVIIDRYNKALSDYNNNQTTITNKDKLDIAQMFNRGFTKGHILKEKGKDFISYDRPNNRGIYLGDVVKVDNKFIYIKLDKSVSKGDGVQFIGKVNTGLVLEKIYDDKDLIDEAKRGKIIKINKIPGVKIGDKVNKTLDINLVKRAEDSYKDTKDRFKIPIYMAIDISLGEFLKLHVWDNVNYVSVTSEERVEKGRNITLTEDKVKKQMEKLGDTAYFLGSIEINLEDGVMVPSSVLNKIRRQAIDELNKNRSNFNKRKKMSFKDLKDITYKTLNFPGNQVSIEDNKLSVMLNYNNLLDKLDLNKLDRVYLKLDQGVENYIKEVNKFNKEVYLYTDTIVENSDFSQIKSLLDDIDLKRVWGISVSDLGSLKFIKDNYNIDIHCDFNLNIFNKSSVSLLREYGVNSLTLSPELKMAQIKDICNDKILSYETLGYGYLPVMTTKYCPLSMVKGCSNNDDCSKCNFNKGYGLKDRKGMRFNLERKKNSTIIYNSQPLMVAEHLYEIYNIGVNMIRLNFTNDSEEIREIQNIYYNYIKGYIDGNYVKKFVNKYKNSTGITKGHYFRGVL